MNLQDWLMEKQGSDDYATLIDGFVEISTNSVGGERPVLKARRQVRSSTFLTGIPLQFPCGRTIKAQTRGGSEFYYLTALRLFALFALWRPFFFHIACLFSIFCTSLNSLFRLPFVHMLTSSPLCFADSRPSAHRTGLIAGSAGLHEEPTSLRSINLVLPCGEEPVSKRFVVSLIWTLDGWSFRLPRTSW